MCAVNVLAEAQAGLAGRGDHIIVLGTVLWGDSYDDARRSCAAGAG
jgi:hypothetical protein